MNLVFLLLAFTAVLKCDALNLLERLDAKYAPAIAANAARVYYYQYTGEDGQVVTVAIPRPPTFRQAYILDAKSRGVLGAFEQNPLAVYENQELSSFVLSDAVKNYKTYEISREIIHYCLDVCPDPEYLKKLLVSAINFDVEEITDMVVSRFSTELKDSFDYYTKLDLAMGTLKTGNFAHVGKLIYSGIIGPDRFFFAEYFCKNARSECLAEYLEFLRFLIVEMEDAYTISSIPRLFAILKTRRLVSQDEFSEVAASYLKTFKTFDAVKAKYAKKLIANDIISGIPPKYYARGVCERGIDAAATIDFLEFLIVKRQDVDVNELIFHDPPHPCTYFGTSRHSEMHPLLLILLKRGTSAEYKEQVGRWLISIGADLSITDEDGKNALELAQEQGINLL